MEYSQILGKVITIIRPFVRDQEKLKNAGEDTDILSDLGVNSARFIDVILAFEDEFNIEIDDEAADNIRSLGDAAKLIVARSQ